MEVSWSSQSELSEELTSSKDEPEAESQLEPAEKGVESLTLSNIKVGIVLVGEVSLESPDGGHLVIVADGHKFVRVGPAACGLSDDLAKLGELLSDLTERFRVQVQKGDAGNTNELFWFCEVSFLTCTGRTYHSQCPWELPATRTDTARTVQTSQTRGNC